MAYFTMCEGYNCKAKLICRRYRAIPDDENQSWFTEKPNTRKNKYGCYVPLKRGEDLNEKE